MKGFRLGDPVPDDPTEDQIMEAFGWSYRPEGVDKIMDQSRHLLRTKEGRRQLYGRALSLAEGVFS